MNPLRFGDKYILLDQIGAGGVAEVFRGKLTRQQGFEKLIVIKKLLPEHNTDREMVEIFISEARLAALLQHDNIAATYDFGELGGEYFLAMEYLFGKNLYAVMARARDHDELFSSAHALAVCSRICEGMEYAHNLTDLQNKPLNLVHRDLTPHNIFATYDGKVKILDFGVAKAEMFDNKTREGVVKGKISYMSPERLSGEDVDSRSDIFSIGILLYEMLGRVRMYQGDTAQLIRKCLTADFKDLREIMPDLDPRIHAILDKALAVDVAQRYQSCADMQADMDDLLYDMGQRADSKFLKDSIQTLFAQEFNAEQNRVSSLCNDFNEATLQKRDKTDISIPDSRHSANEQDKTVFLAYLPALQLLKSKSAQLAGWCHQLLAKARTLVSDPAIDRRYVWTAICAVAGIVLLLMISLSGDGDETVSAPVTSENGMAEPPPPEVVETGRPEPASAVPAEVDEVDEVAAGPENLRDEEPAGETEPAGGSGDTIVAASDRATAEPVTVSVQPAPQTVPAATTAPATIPVLKTTDMKVLKQRMVPPEHGEASKPVADVRPPARDLRVLPAKPPVDTAGQTMSFEEEAAELTRRRNLVMLHTRAEEALQQGRLLQPVKNSAYTYYSQILELDPGNNRAQDGLRRIAEKYAAVADTALAEKQFDRAAAHVVNGLTVQPNYPRLLDVDKRIKRERDEHIHELSEKARLCIDAGKLSVPADDSAYYYYNEILRVDPHSALVKLGYKKIGDTYADMADHSFQEFDYNQADIYVRRGLQVVPDHYYLLYLQEELQRSDLGRVGHSVKKRINKLFSE